MLFKKDFDYLFFEQFLPDNKLWYTIKEVAALLGRSEQCVRDCFDNQKLLGHCLNAKAVIGTEKRWSYSISRQSLILFFMETANFKAQEFLIRFQAAKHQLHA